METGDVVDREKRFWEKHEAFEWLSEDSVASVISRLPSVGGDILELCSGSGMFTRWLARDCRSYTCLDLSESLLARLKERLPRIRTIVGNAEEPELPKNSFDGVFVFAGLHHLSHYDSAIRNAFRLLRDGGRFVCFEPNDKCWYRQLMKPMRKLIRIYTDDEVFLDPDEIREQLGKAGFGEIKTQYLTPRYDDEFLSGLFNKFLARVMYLASAFSPNRKWQSFFLMQGRRV